MSSVGSMEEWGGGWAKSRVGPWPVSLIAAGLVLSLGTRSFAQCDPDGACNVDCDIWVDDCDSVGSGTKLDPFCDIQGAINSVPRDASMAICVLPGTYVADGNIIKFPGQQDIRLVSTNGRDCTFIEGKVEMVRGSRTHLLEGFTISPIAGIGNVGISISGDTRTIRRCRVIGHEQRGIVVEGSSAVIENTIVAYNDGGGIRLTDAASLIEGCTVTDNVLTDGSAGAGLFVDGSSNSTLASCIITENETTFGNGGGISILASGTIKLVNTVIDQNTASGFGIGGGIVLQGAPLAAGLTSEPCSPDEQRFNLEMQNCLVTCNEAHQGGGIYFLVGSGGEIVNTTFTGNNAIDSGGAIGAASTCLNISNSVLWDDSNELTRFLGDSTITIAYSIVEGGCPAGAVCTNVDDSDPLFVDPDGDDDTLCTEDDDLRLGSLSPGINGGLDDAVLPDFGDLDGDENTSEDTPLDLDLGFRFVNTVDTGAYEFPDCPSASIVSADPPSCTYDARRPHDQSDVCFDNREGIGSPNVVGGGPEPITVTLSSAVAGAANPACWSLCETGIEETEGLPLSANSIHSITGVGSGVYEILLDRPIYAGHWTAITYLGGGGSASYGSLPADVNESLVSNATDVLDHIDNCPPQSTDLYHCDTDHSGQVNSTDLLEVIDLLNGAAFHLEWNNVAIAIDACGDCGMSAAMATGEGDAALTFESRNEAFVELVESFVPGERLSAEDFTLAATAVAELCHVDMTASQRAELATMLEDAKPYCQSDEAADLIPTFVEILTE